MTVTFLKKITFLLIVLLSLFFPFTTKAYDPWTGLKDISINNKEDYKNYCASTQFTGNKQLMRCDVTAYDPKGVATKFQFDAIKKSYSNFVLVNDKTALNEDVQLRFTYTPDSDNYFMEGVNFFYKESGPNKSEKGQASCQIITHCCCASIKDAAGNITGIDEKNCKQTFCDCGTNQRDIGICGVAPKAVPISGLTIDQISCGNNKCTKTDKSCTQDSDCTGFSGVGICKNAFCYLDAIGLEKYKASPSLFGIVADLQIRKPILSINIPQLDFTDVQNSVDEEGYLHLPYIGEYISAVYKFAMVIVSIIGVIMIIVVGVKIVVLGGEEKVAGFKRIGQITIGLFIAWGSYAILYNINPDLVNFKALKVKYIETEDVRQYDSLTSQDFADAALGEGSPDKFKYLTECPIKDWVAPIVTLKDNPKRPDPLISKNLPRRLEFHEKIVTRQILKGPISQRIIMASEAAVLCQIHYENCGVGTTNVLALATATGGSYGKSEKCLTYSQKKGTKPCNSTGQDVTYSPKILVKNALDFTTNYNGFKIREVIRGLSCASKKKCDEARVEKRWPAEACFNTSQEATAKLFELLKSTGKWDPSWINELKPGDYYMPVNWNSECNGTHSALFLGWKDPIKHIAWVQMGSGSIFINKGTVNLENVAVVQISRPTEK